MTPNLTPGARVSAPSLPGVVTVVSATPLGPDALTLTFKDPAGALQEAILFPADLAEITIHAPESTATFDGDSSAWRLAAEALRIKYAALYDPMMAITTSEVRPLPHQIRAVYGELLPRTPLRFLLADDPGAGKTIMCGLYIKELLLRGDLEKCLIVAPGSLVDQWQDELRTKFGLNFSILTNDLASTAHSGNVFLEHPHLIARMDHLSRREDFQQQIAALEYDLIVVDEAHRMAAHYYGTELKETKRFELGRKLSENTRHFLLMTATPHAGKDEDFQAFLTLLDPDRFEGQYNKSLHKDDASDIMRRMIKEDLLTMEGKPLFPERRAYTTNYLLSPLELELYNEVSNYVRFEMNRAKKIIAEGDKRRGNTVGFALTVLQRRLASSPEAILRSLERRKERLEKSKAEMEAVATGSISLPQTTSNPIISIIEKADDFDFDDLEDFTGEEVEDAEEFVVDAATAAQTAEELAKEIEVLAGLIVIAAKVRAAEDDSKWKELRAILNGDFLKTTGKQFVEKLIVFTEHKDTLSYLTTRIRDYLGQDEAVVAIYGGTSREDRKRIREEFTENPDVRVLVATDAAGEGLNLQRAHLMVNYDLPWNPNRIEQRFGRIHRIGQTEVCHLWNLVAAETREGAVYERLLLKLEEMRAAYHGKVFDVLGDAFEGQPLRELMMDAVLYGDDPKTKARLDRVIDERVTDGIQELLKKHALEASNLNASEVDEIRRQMEEAQARRLQPHFIRDFFLAAFTQLGGRISEREADRFEITRVPTAVRKRAQSIGTRTPVAEKYQRVTFELDLVAGDTRAALIAPGHALLDATVELTIEQNHGTLRQGAILVDHNTDAGPRLLVALSEEIHDQRQPKPLTVSKKFSFVEIDATGTPRNSGVAPYLDYDAPDDATRERAKSTLVEPWLASGVEETAKAWSAQYSIKPTLERLTDLAKATAARTAKLVTKRLQSEITHWQTERMKILAKRQSGLKTKLSPEGAERKAQDLEDRLVIRLAQIDASQHLSARPARVAGIALIVPGVAAGATASATKETKEVERRGVDAVMAAERALGRDPVEQAFNNPGFDIRSAVDDGDSIFVEVKARIEGSEDFSITRNEVQTAKNLGDQYRLALVRVSMDGPVGDEVHYVLNPFDKTHTNDFRQTKFTFAWQLLWYEGGAPQ